MENMYYLPNQVPFEKQAGLKKGLKKDSILKICLTLRCTLKEASAWENVKINVSFVQ